MEVVHDAREGVHSGRLGVLGSVLERAVSEPGSGGGHRNDTRLHRKYLGGY